ncbi:MAG: SpoIID/LytB domain-containing protein [Candidatus Dojkabacteria bacterium]|nr:MAG: SpoIID/LytB domain-containing protein [Candidatus Dojkabacteria bacterium]
MLLKKNIKNALFVLMILCTTGLALFWVDSTLRTPVRSQSAEDLEEELELTQEQLAEQNRILEQARSQISRITSSSRSVSQKIADLEAVIADLEADIKDTQAQITTKEESIKTKQGELEIKVDSAKEITGQLYRGSRSSLLELIMAQTKSNDLLRALAYRKYVFRAHADQMASLNKEIESLEAEKAALDQEKANLESQNIALDESRQALNAERSNLQAQLNAQRSASNQAQSQINTLNGQITQLQQQILIARSGAFIPPIDSTPIGADYPGTAAGFRELAPSGSYAVFSFGAYTHRNGMSQWGAKARDDAGQNFNQILSAYYPGTTIRTGTVNINGTIENLTANITVTGHGTMPFEAQYLLGIREITGAWNNSSDINVLKAQAIAARTYAIRRTTNGRTAICATESCQVYSPNQFGGTWTQAVQETAGMILTDGNGVPVSTQYAAVHGGYGTGVGWDTTDGSGSGDWMSRAYDRISGVSWFYKAWYRQGYSSSGESCGRYSWLNQEEMADILNAWLVMNNQGVVGNPDLNRIIPVTISTCPIGVGGNPYSMAELRSYLSAPVTSISGLPGIIFTGSGNTSSVVFSTNRGTVVIPGSEFKTIFNTRAPGHLRLPYQGNYYHFNVERKL